MNAIPSKIHVLESILSNAIEKIYLSIFHCGKKKKMLIWKILEIQITFVNVTSLIFTACSYENQASKNYSNYFTLTPCKIKWLTTQTVLPPSH